MLQTFDKHHLHSSDQTVHIRELLLDFLIDKVESMCSALDMDHVWVEDVQVTAPLHHVSWTVNERNFGPTVVKVGVHISDGSVGQTEMKETTKLQVNDNWPKGVLPGYTY